MFYFFPIVLEYNAGIKFKMNPYLGFKIGAILCYPAINGVDLIGYTMWGCIDLVSAGTGEIKKRYGFIYLDMDDLGNGTLKRYKKYSFAWYKKVISSNGSDLK